MEYGGGCPAIGGHMMETLGVVLYLFWLVAVVVAIRKQKGGK